jgi:hypothetical protein
MLNVRAMAAVNGIHHRRHPWSVGIGRPHGPGHVTLKIVVLPMMHIGYYG